MNNKKFQITIIATVIIMILDVVFITASVVFAVPAGTNAAKKTIESTDIAVDIYNAFRECYENGFSSIKASSHSKTNHKFATNNPTRGSVADAGNNIFFLTDKKNKAKVSGALEKKITGSEVDGTIYCHQGNEVNITSLFLDTFNVSLEDLLCNPDGTNGIAQPADKDKTCKDLLSDPSLKFIKSDNGDGVIAKIYEKWKENLPVDIAPDVDSSGKLNPKDKALKYASAFSAFRSDCMQPGKENDFKLDSPDHYYSFTIKMVEDGKLVEKHPHMISERSSDSRYKKNGDNLSNYTKEEDGKKAKCSELAEIINDNFGYHNAELARIRDVVHPNPCATPEIKVRAKRIVSAYEEAHRKHGDIFSKLTPKLDFSKGTEAINKVKDALKIKDSDYTKYINADISNVSEDEYNKLSKSLKDGSFTEDDGNGGKKCLETPNLKTCNSAQSKAKARTVLSDYRDRDFGEGKPLSKAERLEYDSLRKAIEKDDLTIDDGNGGSTCLGSKSIQRTPSGDNEEEEEYNYGDDSIVEEADVEEQKQSYCQENGGFLSWMLCPAIADGASTAGGLLGYITKLTTVHTSIIEQFSKQDSSIYKAWSAFRNIANIGFVIMLLVVVFSQVTNIGISNYNIKKILPKLIVTAILVNFSYLIMGVLIDLSQIAGNGVGALIRSIAVDSMDADASARAADLITKIAGMVTGAAGAVGIGAALLSGPALILPVVMFIVTALISVFFGFIMLTIRQAAIIMVIVLAPLMMVLYALPNTSAITKKYLSIVKSLLMLYPMFIFATSAGALASSIIVGTSEDPLMMIVGGLLNVLPYFAIPSMTSKSLAGLGAITGAFDKIRGGALKGAGMAGGAFGASEFYKNMKSDFNSDKNLNRSLRRLRKYKAIEDAGGTLSTSQRRRQTEAAGAVLKDAKMRAGGSAAAGIALSNYEGAGFAGLQAAAQNELMEAEDKNNMMLFANEGYTPDRMIGMLQDASKADYRLMNDDQKRANDSRIRALTRSLMSTKAGQKAFEKQIASNKDMEVSNRAFGQIAHAALQTPGLADKYQVMNNQFGNYVNKGGDMTGEKLKSGLMGGTYERGMVSTLGDLNAEKLQKISKFEVEKLEQSGLDTTNLQTAFNQLGAASLKDPSLIADFDGIKQERVLEAQKSYLEESQKTTINVRGGGTADVYSAPADFGEIASQRVVNGDVIYTNKNGDTFNASKNQTTKNL